MFQHNCFHGLPLSLQWKIIHAYNYSIQQEQMLNLWKLYSICNSKQIDGHNDLRENNQGLKRNFTTGENGEDTRNCEASLCNKGIEQKKHKGRVELSNGNCSIDMNETMPITPIKKQKENNFFISKKRNRDAKPVASQISITPIKKNVIEVKSLPNATVIDKKEKTIVKKSKMITHTSYEGTKSGNDFMKYNFDYEDKKELNRNSNDVTATIRNSSDEFGFSSNESTKQMLPKLIWRFNDLGIEEKQRKTIHSKPLVEKILKTFERKWPKKLIYDEELALNIFAMNHFNSELTARYFASDSFKNMLTYVAVQKKYQNAPKTPYKTQL